MRPSSGEHKKRQQSLINRLKNVMTIRLLATFLLSMLSFIAVPSIAVPTLAVPTTTPPTVATESIPVDRIIGVVNGHVILESDLITRIDEITHQLHKQSRQLPPHDILVKQVLERLILESIQLQMAHLMGVRIDDNEVNAAMESIAKQNQLSLPQFKVAIEKDGFSYLTLREQIHREITINHVRQRQVNARIQVSDQDVKNFLNSKIGKTELAADYRLGHILIPLPNAPSAEALANTQQLAMDTYHKLQNHEEDFEQLAITLSAGQNALEGGDLGWRSAAQLPTIFADIVLDMEKGALSRPIKSASGFHLIKVTDKRGGTTLFVDQTHVRHILIKPNEIRSNANAERLITDIYQQLSAGADFVDLAKTYSDDPGSALNGGDLGWVSPNTMAPPFEKVMQNTPIETIAKPFRTQFGWHVLEVRDRRNQDMSQEFTLKQARNFIRKRKFEEELQVWLREIREEAFVEIKHPLR
jgi:peptidyl-prolyl cis-trans isomerase SurA